MARNPVMMNRMVSNESRSKSCKEYIEAVAHLRSGHVGNPGWGGQLVGRLGNETGCIGVRGTKHYTKKPVREEPPFAPNFGGFVEAVGAEPVPGEDPKRLMAGDLRPQRVARLPLTTV